MEIGRTKFSSEQQYFHYVRDLFGKKHGLAMNVEAGEYVYEFEYELPNSIAYSTEGKYGEIYYGIKLVLSIPQELDKEIRLPLTVIRYEDLNTMPLLKYPKREETSKTFCWFFICCLGSSPLVISVAIPYSGFVPGQTIPIFIEMNNQSHINVRSTKITLKGLHSFNFDYPSTYKQVEKYRLDYKLAVGVKSGKSLKLEESLKVPEMLNPSNEAHCKVFQITYVIKVAAIVDDPHTTPFVHIPITIGSFPLLFKDQVQKPIVTHKMPMHDSARKTKTAQTLYNEVIRLNDM
jgi:Arrestin (or S-antigen), C-terminal domain/Arrestin (or S-antigen), N-terminal domain